MPPLLSPLRPLLLISLTLLTVKAQMVSPLSSQGTNPIFIRHVDPRLLWNSSFMSATNAVGDNWRTSVFVSTLLDKLLKVDDQDYRFEAVLFLRLSWVDVRAQESIYNRTLETYYAGNGQLCRRECHAGYQQCCDSLWLPGLDLVTAWGLPEERVDYEIISLHPSNRSIVSWIKRFSGVFYTPMNFRRFPFDRQELVIDFWSQVCCNVLIPSATGTKLSTDPNLKSSYADLSSWAVTSITLETYPFDLVVLLAAAKSSAPNDPWPLQDMPNDLNYAWDRTTHDSLRIKIQIRRLSGYYVASFILPVVLCVLLSWWTFWISPQQVETRMSVLVALFLALTALQFTISNQLPASTYMTVMGWILILSYLTIVFSTAETILVYSIFHWYVHRAKEDEIGPHEEGSMAGRGGASSRGKADHEGCFDAKRDASASGGSAVVNEGVEDEAKECEAKGKEEETHTTVAPEGRISRYETWLHRGRLMLSSRIRRSPSLMLIPTSLSRLAHFASELQGNISKARRVIARIERVSMWLFPLAYTFSLIFVVTFVGKT